MRARIATVALILIGIVSSYQPISLALLHVSSENEVLVVLGRPYCLVDVLPNDVHSFGSLIIRQSMDSNQLRRLYLLRYMLAPDLVSPTADADWVIAYYPDHQNGLSDPEIQNWTIVKDCENGVFLLKRKNK